VETGRLLPSPRNFPGRFEVLDIDAALKLAIESSAEICRKSRMGRPVHKGFSPSSQSRLRPVNTELKNDVRVLEEGQHGAAFVEADFRVIICRRLA